MNKFEEFLKVLDAENICSINCIPFSNIIAWDEEDAEYQRLLACEDDEPTDKSVDFCVEGLKSLLDDPYKLQVACNVLTEAPYSCSGYIDTYLKGGIIYQNQLYQLYNQIGYIIDPKEETC